MVGGWIKLHRGLLDWEWYDDHNTCRLFIHCLLKANHKPKKWRGIDIGRGEFFTGLDALSKETGLTVSKLRTSISKLEKTGELASKSQAGGRIITVVGYDSYQDDDKQVSKALASESQDVSKRVAATKNDKKEKNDKNDKNTNTVRVPYEGFVELFNCVLGRELSSVRNITEKRKKAIKAAWLKHGENDIEWWGELFKYIQASDFLTGRASDWQASFDWILKPANLVKIIEGNYENRDRPQQSSKRKLTPLERAIEDGKRLEQLHAQSVGNAEGVLGIHDTTVQPQVEFLPRGND